MRTDPEGKRGWQYTREEVAEMLGVSRRAVWDAEQRAMRKLRKAIEKDERLKRELLAEI